MSAVRRGTSAHFTELKREISKVCPDCGRNLQLIRILDATGIGPNHRPIASTELSYASPDSVEGSLTGLPAAGRIRGWMCPKCHRILIYGEARA